MTINPKTVVGVFSLFIVGICFYILGTATNNYGYVLCAIGVFSLTIVSIPMVTNFKADIFEPICLLWLSVFIGVFLRSFFIVFSDSPKAQFLLDWQAYHSIVNNLHWLLIGLASLVFGYMICNQKISVKLPTLNYQKQKMSLLYGIAIIASLAGAYIFSSMLAIDFSNIEGLSNKRPMELEGQQFTALGHVRMLAGFAEPVIYVVILYLMKKNELYKLKSAVIIFSLFIASSAVPFLNSSRAEVGLVFINILIILHYRSKLNFKHLLVTAVTLLVISTVMANLRGVAQDRGRGNFENEGVIEAVVGSGNFLDIGRTSIIIERVPKNLNHMYGATYFYWTVGWIPRVIWPDKPNVSLGPMVKEDVYKQYVRNHGYPPGLIGEAFINFSYPGIIIVMFIFGYLLKLFYNSFKNILAQNDIALLIYVSILWRFAFGGIGLNLSQMIMQCFMNLVPMLIVIFILNFKWSKRNAA